MGIIGWWEGPPERWQGGEAALAEAMRTIDRPLTVVEREGQLGVAQGGTVTWGSQAPGAGASPVHGLVPPLAPADLGDRSFLADLGLRFPYLGGSMAHGISSPAMAEALGRAGMLGFIGAAGQSPDWVEQAIDRLQRASPGLPFGVNLIHSPNEPHLEEALVDLFLRRGVGLVEASAFLTMTPALVRYRLQGLRQTPDGRVIATTRIVAKASRVEVATKFLSPPPEKMVADLLGRGLVTPEQARLASSLPVAQDITAEADSGGHTDNRPAVCLLPTFLALRDRLQAQFRYPIPLRVGLGGGIATPAAAAAAFAMGAAWVMVGSVHQACVESGTSEAVRTMLAQAGQADIAMAPAGDMFEMGVNVQVLKRGTMFAMRAKKLYELYTAYRCLDDLPAAERDSLEKTIFKAPLAKIWEDTRAYFARRDPSQIERAERDPRHLMALVFRWYLGQSPKWAIAGDPGRTVDYQIWCGPAMGAFNEWAKGSHLEAPAGRRVVEVAGNLLYGAAVVLRASLLRAQGVPVPPAMAEVRPVPASVWGRYLPGAAA
ncbi:MAG: Enoyl-[acyl-carrier-protein] reductase [FMN] [Candidatus Ozemobacter sibiricus]|uniref:Enoyl-[acyl-carrier-protein] reductase [FMN] n=1 Tax=Candidatus Ozemobacter sibiricus TaxID=2268124 RepID=A0A367ZLR0_9BACT|nr:MAG: Enoyl-[acyl-carrier-protein] reductase [FMN] [Candidatus Ozemobacter sibiricus]